ncbi:DNA/RNA non-specific endonuclease [Microbacterium sp. SORGH_AS_0888]|uniref:DNA/RNA non-specific endonuclease n=1 Tax=Microbacterium sp. SORGH_AS_0888 TaxID=3041791 RepID=UPI00277ED5D2|nr:DNA/RNA non-specific endonuclease [Microbacterium sp. SORGH_AS_0888]MDQ1131037.1 uncharacterized protein YukE [Microbacterium sp. SORGH_AS_0888]
MSNPLIAIPEPYEPSSGISGAYLLEDGYSLAVAITRGDWVEGGLSGFSYTIDAAGWLLDPLGTLIANGLGWLIEHLEPLRGWMQDLTGNANEVQAFAQTWSNAAERLDQVGTTLNQRISDLDGMSGETVDAYRAHLHDLAQNISATGQWASAVSSGLQLASTLVQAVYGMVRDALSQIVGTALSAAFVTGVTAGLGAPEAAAEIGARVSMITMRVGVFVMRLLRSLREAVPLIRRLAEVIEKITTRLHGRLPGTTPLAPKTAPDAPLPAVPRLRGGTVKDGWRPLSRADIDQLPIVRDGSHLNPDGSLRPNTWYQAGEHDYIYHTDENGHIDRFYAEELGMKTHEGRLPHDRDSPGKLPGDHAGHLAGDFFGGSPKLDNIVSQFSDINLSQYKKLENQWASALKTDPPGHVTVDIKITTDATGRPTKFEVESTVNGRAVDAEFNQ